jgi:hypothetical protein
MVQGAADSMSMEDALVYGLLAPAMFCVRRAIMRILIDIMAVIMGLRIITRIPNAVLISEAAYGLIGIIANRDKTMEFRKPWRADIKNLYGESKNIKVQLTKVAK